jgi:CubicO group peptidase (beta-lactamase class C family)
MRVALVLLVLMFPAMAAAEKPPVDLAETLAPLAAKYKLPGVVGAVIHGDKIVALGSVGIRRVGDPTLFLPSDVIHLGSCTKAMTAILIAQLVDKKQLRFDSTMRELFPDLAKDMNPVMANNTVRNLLNHDGGFPHDLPWGVMQATHLPLVAQRRMALIEALSDPPATPIGSYSYSNVGFVLLGAIVEAKTGKPWERVMQEQIFGPLHMDSAGFGSPGTIGKVDEPWGHFVRDGKLTASQIDNLPVMAPAGEVHCSISDWSKFIAEILRSTQGHPALTTARTFEELTTSLPGQTYAGGWEIVQRDWAGGLALSHEGNNTVFCCDVWIAPKKDFAVLIATNFGGEGSDKAVDERAELLINLNSQLTRNP